MSEQVQGVITRQGRDISALCNLTAARYNLPPRVLVAQAIAESDLDEQACRFGVWPDVSFGLWQQTVLYACVGDRTDSPANIDLCRQRFCTDLAFAADTAAQQLASYYQQYGSYHEAASRYNGGPGMAYADNPNQANLDRAWEASARYVVGGVATASAASAVAEEVLAAASRLIGTPYGLPPGPGELDCSLFILKGCADAGYPWPSGIRTAEQIRLNCDLVTAEPNWNDGLVQRGDLLFFENTGGENPGDRAGHVGFALLDGRMLDANEAHGVGYTRLSSWWTERLFEARRPPQYAAPAAPPFVAPTAPPFDPPVAPPFDAPSELEQLRRQVAEERSFSSALMHDVIGTARQQLEALARRDHLTNPAADLAPIIELLRKHER